MSKIQLIISTLFTLVVILIGSLLSLPKTVTFKSTESKVENDFPVFNEISLEEKGDFDVWTMNQSHHGLNLPKGNWDKIQIIVNKKNNSSSFFQLKDGKSINFKAKCIMCHSNGPRAIRPETKGLKLSERIKIFIWNLRIKSYGTLSQNLKSHSPKLHSETCLKCHNGGNMPWERAKLTKDHFLAIKYLVKNDLMPPWPYRLIEKEKELILEQLR